MAQPLTEMSTLWLKELPVYKADNFTTISRKCGSLDGPQPYWSPHPVTGIAVTLLLAFTPRILLNATQVAVLC
jgi:hypothetical protein